MNNYPDGFNLSSLDGPKSLADQVTEDALVLQDSIYVNEPTIISQGEDYNSAEEFIEDQFNVNHDDLLEHLDLQNNNDAESIIDAEEFVDYLLQNVTKDLDQLLLDAYDGIYGSDATDIDPI